MSKSSNDTSSSASVHLGGRQIKLSLLEGETLVVSTGEVELCRVPLPPTSEASGGYPRASGTALRDLGSAAQESGLVGKALTPVGEDHYCSVQERPFFLAFNRVKIPENDFYFTAPGSVQSLADSTVKGARIDRAWTAGLFALRFLLLLDEELETPAEILSVPRGRYHLVLSTGKDLERAPLIGFSQHTLFGDAGTSIFEPSGFCSTTAKLAKLIGVPKRHRAVAITFASLSEVKAAWLGSGRELPVPCLDQ